MWRMIIRSIGVFCGRSKASEAKLINKLIICLQIYNQLEDLTMENQPPKTRQERKGLGKFCKKRTDNNYNQKAIRIQQILRERSKNNYKKST